MTVKEVAEVLGVSEITIQKKAKELFPESVKNGIATRLDKYQVQEIKENLVPRNLISKYKVDSAVTELDIENMTTMVIQYHVDKAKRLEADNKRLQAVNKALCADVEAMTPKALTYDQCCSSDNLHSIQDLGKETGIGAHNIFTRLVNDGIIYRTRQDGDEFYRSRSEYDKWFKAVVYPLTINNRSSLKHKLMLTSDGFMHFCKRYGVNK